MGDFSLNFCEELFYDNKHKHITKAILELYKENAPIDLITVTTKLSKLNLLDRDAIEIGNPQSKVSPYYIVELTNRVASDANLEYHLRILIQTAIERDLSVQSLKTIELVKDGTHDVFDVHQNALEGVINAADKYLGSRQNSLTISDATDVFLSHLEKKMNGDIVDYVLTNMPTIDNVIGGYGEGELGIIAARPGMGKTSLVLSLAKECKVPYMIFSLESPVIKIIPNLISMHTGIPFRKLTINAKELTPSDLSKIKESATILKEIQKSFIIDSVDKLSDICSIIRKKAKTEGLRVVYIDYLQLIVASENNSRGFGNREQDVSHISRTLKNLAMELKITIIALSQLSRAVEARANKRPQLSDLRESGAIEQDADFVAFIYRPEYYGFLLDDDGNDTKGIAQIDIAKVRNNDPKSVNVRFKGECKSFEDVAISDKEWQDVVTNQPTVSTVPNVSIPMSQRDIDDIPF